MQRCNRSASTVIALAVLIFVAVVSPCRAQTWSYTVWDEYIADWGTPDSGNHGSSFSAGTNYTWDDDWGVSRAVYAILNSATLTAWVNLEDEEDSVTASASSYTLAGITWEWTGAPGTAPAMEVGHYSTVHGEVWAAGTASDEGIYPYPSLSVEAEAEGSARVVSDAADTEVSGYATGWVDGAHSQSTAYAVLIGNNDYLPDYHSTVSGANGHFDYDVEYWLTFVDYYQTDSGMDAIDGIAGVALSAWCSGSASDIDNDTSVTGEGGIWHGASSATVGLFDL